MPAVTAATGRRDPRATFAAMHLQSVHFAYFWYSNRPAAGEASAHAH